MIHGRLRQRERGDTRVDRPVVREEDATDEIVDDDARPQLADPIVIDDLGRQAGVSCDRHGHPDLAEPLLVPSHRQRPDLPEPGVDPRLPRDSLVRLDVDPRQLGQRMGATDLRHEAGGIAEADYQAQRAELKRQLAAIWKADR